MNGPALRAVTPVELTFELREAYLYVLGTSESADEEAVLDAWRRVAAECARVGARKILVETRLKRQMSVAGYYHVSQELPKMGFGSVRIAFLDRRNLDFERIRFGETVAVNRGLYGRVFFDLQEAEVWLAADL